jgi:hypothetical protein
MAAAICASWCPTGYVSTFATRNVVVTSGEFEGNFEMFAHHRFLRPVRRGDRGGAAAAFDAEPLGRL